MVPIATPSNNIEPFRYRDTRMKFLGPGTDGLITISTFAADAETEWLTTSTTQFTNATASTRFTALYIVPAGGSTVDQVQNLQIIARSTDPGTAIDTDGEFDNKDDVITVRMNQLVATVAAGTIVSLPPFRVELPEPALWIGFRRDPASLDVTRDVSFKCWGILPNTKSEASYAK